MQTLKSNPIISHLSVAQKHVPSMKVLRTSTSLTSFLRKLLKDSRHQNKGAVSLVFLRRKKSWGTRDKVCSVEKGCRGQETEAERVQESSCRVTVRLCTEI